MQPRGLGMPPILAASLAGALGEQLVELLDRDPGGLAEAADGRSRAALQIGLAHEVDDLPVAIGQLLDAVRARDLLGDLLVPLLSVGEEALGVDLDGRAGERHGAHREAPRVRPGARGLGGMELRADAGDVVPRQQHVPVERLERELGEVVEPRLGEQRQRAEVRLGEAAGERLGLVVEVDQQRLVEARLDEAVGVAVVEAGQLLTGEEPLDVLDDRLALEVGDRARPSTWARRSRRRSRRCSARLAPAACADRPGRTRARRRGPASG